MFFDNMLRNVRELMAPPFNMPAPTFRRFQFVDWNPLRQTVKYRTLYAPNKTMFSLQRRFLLWLRSRQIHLPCAYGSRKGCSPLLNVKRHQWNRYFYLLDISNAYQNIEARKLAELVCDCDSSLIGEEDKMHEFLQQYFLLPDGGGLATGGPASPDLYNLYAGILLDRRLQELCKQYGITYTRYLDDLTFSSKGPIGPRKRLAIRRLIQSCGFPLNLNKCVKADILKQAVVINGIGLKGKGRIFLPRHYLRRLRGLLHLATFTTAISSPKVQGMMGVFFSITDRNCMNRSEWKVLKAYIVCTVVFLSANLPLSWDVN